MQKFVRPLALALVLILALPVLAQDMDAEACALAALADVTLPGEPGGVLDALIALRDRLNDIIVECSGPAAIEADEGYPRTMYVSSRPGWINVRAEANTAAAIVTTLSNRTPVEVYGVAQGESFLGSTRWFRALVEGQEVWIHGLLLWRYLQHRDCRRSAHHPKVWPLLHDRRGWRCFLRASANAGGSCSGP